MLKLFNYYRSSASFRVRITLNLKKLPYQEIPIHLTKDGGEQYTPEYQAINPQNMVPVLQNGDHIISQSLAIIDYLEDLHPTPSVFPTDNYQRALARSFALIIAADTHPLNNLRVLKYLTQDLHISEEQKNKWYQHWIAKGLAALEKNLQASSFVGEFCFGDQLTIADICLVPQMYNARRFNCDLSAYPILNRIDTACQKEVAFQAAWPQEESAA